MTEVFNPYKELFNRIIKDCKFSRLGRVFKTDMNYYFYDVGTGKVFQVDNILYDILQALSITNKFDSIFTLRKTSESELINALEQLKEVIENENILQAPPVNELTGNSVVNLDQALDSSLEQITLEVTESCNMRCKYCIYHSSDIGFRNFGEANMSFDIAKIAIDELMNKSQGMKEVSIGFYGGEPLLNFGLIKNCINYCQEEYKDKKIYYTMTTNATLIDKEIANFISTIDNFSITVSLDGSKEVHDKHRVLMNGKGSFIDTMNGVKLLSNAFGDKVNEYISFNAVIDDNVDLDYMKALNEFFSSIEWTTPDTTITLSYILKEDRDVEYLGIDSEREQNIREKNKQKNHSVLDKFSFQRLVEQFENQDKNNSKSKLEIGKGALVQELNFIHNRILNDEPVNQYKMNGCCVPGSRRTYVTVKGEYLLCERIGPCPSIGDVFNGLDKNKIRKHYVEDFRNESVKYCKDCWAIHLCSLCYMSCYKEDGINISYRHQKCELNRASIEEDLIRYHYLLEKYPEEFETLLNSYTYS
ncbi:radical SAM domain-containing protein [Gottschalkia acidurici 9a]|uniref:Radical SAM domain-containing protein n=1 Tax=Gottschalkia acidurici (strain ATCC 7906 / DSM 604 / BCRC 14475 / CIP 104303 / KCTC 5404 / NCIMB 10678 / 9a) TaxID=1128398 RepID=K0AV43_GOTA9|nr:radical SAM protein [Gottschalkia acidurici]AFS77134.1 radical SAM domain-containing protein [Gottschalkia acidurici 9a]